MDSTSRNTFDRRPSGSAVLRESVTETIRRAVFEELAETGYARMSMEAVTRRARVGKAALYRRWPAKEVMVVELVSEAAAAHLPATADSGSLHDDVERFIRHTMADLRHPLAGRIIPDLVAESARNPSLRDALYQAVLGPRRAAVATLLRQAVDRGELPGDIDMGLAVDIFEPRCTSGCSRSAAPPTMPTSPASPTPSSRRSPPPAERSCAAACPAAERRRAAACPTHSRAAPDAGRSSTDRLRHAECGLAHSLVGPSAHGERTGRRGEKTARAS